MSTLTFEQIDRFLYESGFLRFQDQLSTVMDDFGQYIEGTQRVLLGKHADKYFNCFDSALDEIQSNKQHQQQDLEFGYVIDFGGTNTRIVKFSIVKGIFTCLSVERLLNEQLQSSDNLTKNNQPIVQCFKEVVRRIVQSSDNNPQSIKAVSIIWSNASVSSKLTGSVSGITNKVCGINNGKDYLKNEWFIKGLYDGQDLGQIFLGQCEDANIQLKKLVMGNDTVFVGLAYDGASAAGVISTGANMASLMIAPSTKEFTCANKTLKQNYRRWYNLECGANFYIKDVVVSDVVSDKTDLSIQSLIAGGWFLDRYFKILSEVLESIGISKSSIKDKAILNSKWFNKVFKYSLNLERPATDIFSVVNNPEGSALFYDLFDSTSSSSEAVYCALRLAYIIGQRVLALSSAMIAGAVLNYDSTVESIVLMDSRVLEGLDTDLNIVNKYLSILNRPNIRILLIKEDNSSVGAGIIGAARSLNCIKFLE